MSKEICVPCINANPQLNFMDTCVMPVRYGKCGCCEKMAVIVSIALYFEDNIVLIPPKKKEEEKKNPMYE
jgi:hypothetical protein